MMRRRLVWVITAAALRLGEIVVPGDFSSAAPLFAVVALVPGDRRADSGKIARAAGARFARIAGSEEVRDATGFEPGAVCPFPLPRVSAVFVERTLLSQPVLWVGAGSERHMAALSPIELLRLSRARPMDVVEQAPYHST